MPRLLRDGRKLGRQRRSLIGYDWDIERFANPYPMVVGNSGYDQGL